MFGQTHCNDSTNNLHDAASLFQYPISYIFDLSFCWNFFSRKFGSERIDNPAGRLYEFAVFYIFFPMEEQDHLKEIFKCDYYEFI